MPGPIATTVMDFEQLDKAVALGRCDGNRPGVRFVQRFGHQLRAQRS